MTNQSKAYSTTTIQIQGDDQDAFEVYADESREQTIAFCFDTETLRKILAIDDLLAFAENSRAALEENGPDANLGNILDAARAAVAKARGEGQVMTNQSKHTPGPWHLKILIGDTFVAADESPENGGDIICNPPESCAKSSLAYWKANAHLIAAAPELLEALQYAVDNPEFKSESFDALARTAIAKARGEA